MESLETPSRLSELLVSRQAKRRRSEQEDQPGRKLNLGRHCFVTIGATAGFRQLLVEILQPEFLQCLGSYGYDILDVQCGPDYEWFLSQVDSLTNTYGVAIRHFKYTDNMQDHMLECRGEAGVRLPGCIISHAGSGTILEALRYQAPLVVVPNPTLMDNHQAELAEECEQQNWAIYGKLGDLPFAIRRSHERLAQGRHDHDLLPAPYSPPPFPVPESERVTLFDWMVLTCYPEELSKQEHLRKLADSDAMFTLEKQQRIQQPVQQNGQWQELEQVQERRSRLQMD